MGSDLGQQHSVDLFCHFLSDVLLKDFCSNHVLLVRDKKEVARKILWEFGVLIPSMILTFVL